MHVVGDDDDRTALFSQKMIFDEVALGLRLRGITDEAQLKERVEKVLKVCFPGYIFELVGKDWFGARKLVVRAQGALFSLILFKSAHLKWQQVSFIIKFIALFSLLNLIGARKLVVRAQGGSIIERVLGQLVISRD